MASTNGGRMVRGSFIATGVALVVNTPEKPLRVELINVDDPAVAIHHDQMPAASCIVGTTTYVWVTSNGITLSDAEAGDSFTGFTVGTDANINTDTEQIFWTAWY